MSKFSNQGFESIDINGGGDNFRDVISQRVTFVIFSQSCSYMSSLSLVIMEPTRDLLVPGKIFSQALITLE